MEIVQCAVNCTFKHSLPHEPVIKPKPKFFSLYRDLFASLSRVGLKKRSAEQIRFETEIKRFFYSSEQKRLRNKSANSSPYFFYFIFGAQRISPPWRSPPRPPPRNTTTTRTMRKTFSQSCRTEARKNRRSIYTASQKIREKNAYK